MGEAQKAALIDKILRNHGLIQRLPEAEFRMLTSAQLRDKDEVLLSRILAAQEKVIAAKGLRTITPHNAEAS